MVEIVDANSSNEVITSSNSTNEVIADQIVEEINEEIEDDITLIDANSDNVDLCSVDGESKFLFL